MARELDSQKRSKDQDIVLLNLQQGTNRLLFKIQNARGDWGFACRALGPKVLEEKLWTAARGGDLEKLELILTYGKDIEINSKPRSTTKQFTAAAILRLQEQGKLNVSDPLSKFIPDFPKGNEVAFHHLLTHTSGIHGYTNKPDFLQSVYSR